MIYHGQIERNRDGGGVLDGFVTTRRCALDPLSHIIFHGIVCGIEIYEAVVHSP